MVNNLLVLFQGTEHNIDREDTWPVRTARFCYPCERDLFREKDSAYRLIFTNHDYLIKFYIILTIGTLRSYGVIWDRGDNLGHLVFCLNSRHF